MYRKIQNIVDKFLRPFCINRVVCEKISSRYFIESSFAGCLMEKKKKKKTLFRHVSLRS